MDTYSKLLKVGRTQLLGCVCFGLPRIVTCLGHKKAVVFVCSVYLKCNILNSANDHYCSVKEY